MLPVRWDEADLAGLPAHTVIVWAQDQPQYQPLTTVRLEGPEGRVISRWTFTAEERSRIAAGEDLYLEQLTFRDRLQPLKPSVGLPDYCPADSPTQEARTQ